MPIEKRALTMIDELEELRKTRDDHWQVPRIEGELLHQIALAAGARCIVEVGTSYGFSGLFWGSAAARFGGKLHTIDVAQKKFDSSRQTFTKAGLDQVIVNHLGDGEQVLRTLVPSLERDIDIAFLDGGNKAGTTVYFDLVWPRIRKGGAVITDNATTHRADLASFVSRVRSMADATSIEVAVGNGIEWTIKTG